MSNTPIRTTVLASAAILAAVALAPFGSSADATPTPVAAQSAVCAKDQLPLTTIGKLTVATDSPAFPPYFEDNDPTNGKGFESAVAVAVAEQLGFSSADVNWVVEPFNSSFAPGPKSFDFDINEVSITATRAKSVDFSSPYFTAPQAVIALKGTATAKATTLTALKDVQFGVLAGTTSLDVINDVIKPSQKPEVFKTNTAAIAALNHHKVDAIVVDEPTALFVTGSGEAPHGKIVGQFPAPGSDSDTWGTVLTKGSALTPCVNQAIATLRSSGKLQQITQRWMGQAAGVPTLTLKKKHKSKK
jgi:polar amino acid transport system substrate-binding protein